MALGPCNDTQPEQGFQEVGEPGGWGCFSGTDNSGFLAGLWGGLRFWLSHTALDSLGLTVDPKPCPGAVGSKGLTSLTSFRAQSQNPLLTLGLAVSGRGSWEEACFLWHPPALHCRIPGLGSRARLHPTGPSWPQGRPRGTGGGAVFLRVGS